MRVKKVSLEGTEKSVQEKENIYRDTTRGSLFTRGKPQVWPGM